MGGDGYGTLGLGLELAPTASQARFVPLPPDPVACPGCDAAKRAVTDFEAQWRADDYYLNVLGLTPTADSRAKVRLCALCTDISRTHFAPPAPQGGRVPALATPRRSRGGRRVVSERSPLGLGHPGGRAAVTETPKNRISSAPHPVKK